MVEKNLQINFVSVCFYSKKHLSSKGEAMKVEKELIKTIGYIAKKKDNLEELDLFFQEIFTPGELADLSLRWKLLTDLNKGMTQRRIAEKYSISLCKITRGSKILKKKNSIVLKILKNNGEKSEK